MRSYLIRRDFSTSAVSGVISAFRETMQVVSSEEEKTPVVAALPAPEPAAAPLARTHIMRTNVSNVQPAGAVPWLVSLDGTALDVQARLDNSEAVDKLIAVLQATKVLLPPTPDATKQEAQQASGSEAQH